MSVCRCMYWCRHVFRSTDWRQQQLYSVSVVSVAVSVTVSVLSPLSTLLFPLLSPMLFPSMSPLCPIVFLLSPVLTILLYYAMTPVGEICRDLCGGDESWDDGDIKWENHGDNIPGKCRDTKRYRKQQWRQCDYNGENKRECNGDKNWDNKGGSIKKNSTVPHKLWPPPQSLRGLTKKIVFFSLFFYKYFFRTCTQTGATETLTINKMVDKKKFFREFLTFFSTPPPPLLRDMSP